ncbi:uncharacterized protein LOC133529818 [Cydia pomonella]|uniref:uncharacterized protein LOC133529818 n=1 Tax=Cydia pomonella TaxID=82600 RepID=UPI002ADDA277|nr:uncharacterized protein LOC133529818 [Cydia pomonella]
MRTLLIIYISFLLWQVQGGSKKSSKPCGLAQPEQLERPTSLSDSKYSVTEQNSYRKFLYSGPLKLTARRMVMHGAFARKQSDASTTITTTTKIYFDNDCDYIQYYCFKGYYTGRLCGKTVYNTYENFENFCEMEYVNCLENYDLWSIAHMGECFNVTSFQTFAYYAYAVWDDNQLEEMYVMPAV